MRKLNYRNLCTPLYVGLIYWNPPTLTVKLVLTVAVIVAIAAIISVTSTAVAQSYTNPATSSIGFTLIIDGQELEIKDWRRAPVVWADTDLWLTADQSVCWFATTSDYVDDSTCGTTYNFDQTGKSKGFHYIYADAGCDDSGCLEHILVLMIFMPNSGWFLWKIWLMDISENKKWKMFCFLKLRTWSWQYNVKSRICIGLIRHTSKIHAQAYRLVWLCGWPSDISIRSAVRQVIFR